MSRISDVVDKIMHISGEMNIFKSCQHSEVSKGKNGAFSQFTSGNLWESKRTRSINFHQLFNTHRVEFIGMHVNHEPACTQLNNFLTGVQDQNLFGTFIE